MFNGSRGRLELEVVESDHVSPAVAGDGQGRSLHGAEAAAEGGSVSLRLRPFWQPPRRGAESPATTATGHGGADARMTAVLFGAADRPAGRSATARDGALALLTGLAANESIATGAPGAGRRPARSDLTREPR